MRFDGKTALVTGAGGGIGRAVALAMAREGAELVLNDITVKPLDEIAAQVRALQKRALIARADITRSAEVRQMVRDATVELGGLDILVNTAGGSRTSAFHETPDEYWNAVIDLNLKGTLICCHEIIEPMINRGRGGRIVNVSSAAGVIGTASLAPYSAAKAGVIGFTKALAKELAPYGIYVNCVSPGPTLTPLMDCLTLEYREKMVQSTYLKRAAKPEEVANMILFLASNEASYITGQNYSVCGGRTLGW